MADLHRDDKQPNSALMSDSAHSPSIDVVIPVFNRSAELARALDSLTCQTDPNFGIIICDDGSSEDISAVTCLYKDRLTIDLVRIENSGGPARPRNVATSRSNADWISFLDSDDYWYPERMAAVRDALTSDCDLVYHLLREERPSPQTYGSQNEDIIIGNALQVGDPIVHMLRFGNPIPTSACTVRRRSLTDIGGFEESQSLASVEDFDAWLRVCAAGARLKCVESALGAYWVGDDQISTFSIKQMTRQENLFRRQMELLPPQYRELAASNFNYLLGSYAIALGLPNARQYYSLVSFRLEPLRWLKARAKILRAVSQAVS